MQGRIQTCVSAKPSITGTLTTSILQQRTSQSSSHFWSLNPSPSSHSSVYPSHSSQILLLYSSHLFSSPAHIYQPFFFLFPYTSHSFLSLMYFSQASQLPLCKSRKSLLLRCIIVIPSLPEYFSDAASILPSISYLRFLFFNIF